MRKKVLFIGMLVTLLFAFSGCGTKNEGVVTLIMSDVQEGDHPTAQACALPIYLYVFKNFFIILSP